MSRHYVKGSFFFDPSQSDGYWEDESAQCPAFTVHEDELETFTGILNRHGQEIHRSERIAMGFHCSKSRDRAQ